MLDASTHVAPYLSCMDLRLDLGGKTLINVPELSFRSKGITSIMGPNGAGKSLLLRLLHGLETPTSGNVHCDKSLTSQALVFQKPVLLRRSVEANVRFVLKAKRQPLDRVPELLSWVRLSKQAKAPARRLSGGEQQRLAIARALAMQPSLLFLDEPSASLDPSSTRLIEQILVETASRGVRVILVTHDKAQAGRISDDVVFLAGGRVVEHAPANVFFEAPRSPLARAYLAGDLIE